MPDNNDRLFIDYSKIDERYLQTIQAIESKGHVMYIRYMLTKRYNAATLRSELKKLGLSAPHEHSIKAYFEAVIWPAAEKFGVQKIYNRYKNRILYTKGKTKNFDYAKDILNFRLHLAEEYDLHPKFLKFIKYLDIDSLWLNEVHKFFGSSSNFPLNEDGTKIITCTSPSVKLTDGSVERIIRHPKRYIIDKLILENVPESRICLYAREELSFPLYDMDIRLYKKAFFNIRVRTIEEKIKLMEAEKNSLFNYISDMKQGKNTEVFEMSIGDRASVIKAAEQRTEELGECIHLLNSAYHESINNAIIKNADDTSDMFQNMFAVAYRKFLKLSDSNDRDVVTPLCNIAKTMMALDDKLKIMRAKKNLTNTDVHSGEAIFQLFKDNPDLFTEDNQKKTAPDNILGIEELGVAYVDPNEDNTNGSSNKTSLTAVVPGPVDKGLFQNPEPETSTMPIAFAGNMMYDDDDDYL